ncbi:MAG: hypothetical protein ACXITR_02320 [Cyanobacterium sp.]
MAPPSRKNSPDYLKSRMGTFLNPLFLTAVVGLGVIGIVAWQLIVINDQFRQVSRETPPPSSTGATVEVEEVDGVENQNESDNTSENTSLNPENNVSSPQNPTGGENLSDSEDIAEFDILGGGSRDTIQGATPNRTGQTRLYEQVLSLPRISPQVRPSGGDSNNNLINQGLLSPELNEQRQSSQTSISPSPLNQAVSNVMTNYNPRGNMNRPQSMPSNVPPVGSQIYNPPSVQNNSNMGNNNNPIPWVSNSQGVGTSPNQGSANVPSARPSQTNQSPF